MWRSVGLAGGAKESVSKITSGDVIVPALDGLAKLLDALPAELSLRVWHRCLGHNLTRKGWDCTCCRCREIHHKNLLMVLIGGECNDFSAFLILL